MKRRSYDGRILRPFLRKLRGAHRHDAGIPNASGRWRKICWQDRGGNPQRGLRSLTRSFYCALRMKSCRIEKKGLDFCSECGDYCAARSGLQAQAPVPVSLSVRVAFEYERWTGAGAKKMERNYACAECGRSTPCTSSPAGVGGAVLPNEFVRRNGKMILKHAPHGPGGEVMPLRRERRPVPVSLFRQGRVS